MPSAVNTVPAVTPPVDLQVQLLGAPNPSYTSEAITLTATVRNASADAASGLQLVLAVPAAAQVQHQPEGPGWTCSQVTPDGSTATCTSSAQAGLSVSEVWLALLPDVTAQSLSATAILSSATTDSDPTNNRAMVVIPIMYDADTYRAPAVGGGGFGCAQSGGAPAHRSEALITALVTLILVARRRGRQNRPDPAPRS
jgi:hypothetical protein